MTRSFHKKEDSFDSILLLIIAILGIFGFIMIASAGTVYADIRYNDAYFFLRRQTMGLLLGIGALFVFSRIDYRRLRPLAVPGFLLSIGLLIALFIPGLGTSVYGATRWISLGPFAFQPSEMAKLFLVIYLSAWLSSRGARNISKFSEGLVPFIAILGTVAFLLLKQPDMGTLIVMIAISGSLFFVAGGRIKHILGTMAIGCVVFLFLIRIEEYRWNRLMVFLNPGLDTQGKGYHIQQALIAVGSGGFFGLGLGNSYQKFNYLPEPAGDSIFAIIGEELGFVGTFSLVALFSFLAFRGYRIASGISDKFGKFLAVGLTSWIVSQAFINMAAITGLVPLTGIPLPFISYGGSSIVFSLAAMGILLNISKHRCV